MYNIEPCFIKLLSLYTCILVWVYTIYINLLLILSVYCKVLNKILSTELTNIFYYFTTHSFLQENVLGNSSVVIKQQPKNITP